jgi:DNA ligase (NAD+)
VLTPVARFESIEIDGAEISRATLNNLSVLKEKLNEPYQGQKLWISKRNQVIPYVEEAEKYNNTKADIVTLIPMPKICPICGGNVVIKTSDAGIKNLYCDNPSCPGKLSQQIDHYCNRKKGLDIRGLSRATIDKLIDLGWLDNIIDIYSLKEHRTEWIKLAGFGEKSVDKILNAIEESKHCKLENFISALGIPLIGLTVAKSIVEEFPTWEEFKAAIGGEWSVLPGFGSEMERALNSFDYSEADKIAEMLIFEDKTTSEENRANPAQGLTFVITGKLSRARDAITADIISAGGKVTGSVSSKTSYLVCNDKNSNTGKSKKAKDLNIPIITEDELLEIIS